MAFFSLNNLQITGISACVPKNTEYNLEYKLLSEEDRIKLIKTTGIEYRHVATKEQCASDLCYQSAVKLLSELKWNPEDIDALIFVSQTGDYILPATSIILQSKLKIPSSCIAFDIGLGCSGYIYGLSVIGGLLTSCNLKRGLLLVGDTITKTVSVNDRSAFPLFGDAGTATAIENIPGTQPIHFHLAGDGDGFKSIIIPDGGYRNPVTENSLINETISDGIIRNKCNLALDGVEIFNFSLREAPKSVTELLNYSHLSVEDIDCFIFHQANRVMNEAIRKKLKISPEKVPFTLTNYGNTSSATIPLTIVSELNTKIQKEPMTLLLCGFGVGLSWGSAIIKTNLIICPEVIEL